MTKLRLLAREALKLTKARAPINVREMILPHLLDEVDEFTRDIAGDLTTLNGDDQTAVTMAYGIVRDRLIKEVIEQLEQSMHEDLDKRLKKFSKLSTEKK